MIKPLFSVFFVISGIGFAVNVLLLERRPLMRGFFWPVLLGGAAVGVLAARTKRMQLAALILSLEIAVIWLALKAIPASVIPVPNELKSRIIFDAVGIVASIALGYRVLISFLTGEGLANLRLQTELSLAHEIQAVLVPPISYRGAALEAYGRSIPSEKVGGDLVDIIEAEGLLAYVADVSGHGLPAGQLMGMLKTAVRVALQFQRGPAGVLDAINRVLPAVKQAHMYATVAWVFFHGSQEAEYTLAGHPPILHYHQCSGEVSRLAMEQFPVGLLPSSTYSSERAPYSSGDVFLIISDGIVEVDDGDDDEFGLERLERLLIKHAFRSLPEICDVVLEEVRRHGPQLDDQSLLLIRARGDLPVAADSTGLS
jgi:serine phosphatase RsbU (regulator of sigma subunit)